MHFVVDIQIERGLAFIIVFGTAAPVIIHRFDRKVGRAGAVIVGVAIALTDIVSMPAFSPLPLNF